MYYALILISISMFGGCFALTSCDILDDILVNQDSTNKNEEFDTNKVTLTSAYSMAHELGFEGTLEEFIEYISGEDGKPIPYRNHPGKECFAF